MPWTWRDAALVILVGVAGGIVLAVPMMAAAMALGLDEGGRHGALILVQPVAYVLAALAVLAWRHPGRLGALLGARGPAARDVPLGVLTGLGGFVLSNLLVANLVVWALLSMGLEVPPVQETFQQAAADPAALPFLILGAVVLAPVGEEVVFRGVLYPALARRIARGHAMWVSALVFALVHASLGAQMLANVTLAVVLLPFGFLLAWLYERSGSLVAPILAHAAFNAISVSQLVA